MPSQSHTSPLGPAQLVDEYFIENRTRLLEIAAFLDRVGRADPDGTADDFRMKAFAEAIDALSVPGDRLTRIQHILSDPTTGPLERLDRKSARGAYDRWSSEARS
jgi:hypothetical protein